MLSNTELRIGNLIVEGNTISKITSLGVDSLTVRAYKMPTNSITIMYESITGLPFSSGFLNEYGWYEVADGKPNYYKFFGKKSVGTGPINGFFEIEFPYDKQNNARVWTPQDGDKEYQPGSSIIMASCHQLQNFIWELTHKEISELP